MMFFELIHVIWSQYDYNKQIYKTPCVCINKAPNNRCMSLWIKVQRKLQNFIAEIWFLISYFCVILYLLLCLRSEVCLSDKSSGMVWYIHREISIKDITRNQISYPYLYFISTMDACWYSSYLNTALMNNSVESH